MDFYHLTICFVCIILLRHYKLFQRTKIAADNRRVLNLSCVLRFRFPLAIDKPNNLCLCLIILIARSTTAALFQIAAYESSTTAARLILFFQSVLPRCNAPPTRQLELQPYKHSVYKTLLIYRYKITTHDAPTFPFVSCTWMPSEQSYYQVFQVLFRNELPEDDCRY